MELREAIERHRAATFAYGRMDCFLFVCGVIQDVTGRDFAAPWRGQYQTALRARRIIVQHGGWRELLCGIFGPLHPVWSVRAGDPVLLDPRAVEQDAVAAGIGIWDGQQVIALGDGGAVDLPLGAALGCWHV